MGKTKRKGAQSPFTDGPSPFVQLPWPMLDSMAFKRLSCRAVWLLVQMMRHYRAGRFILPYRDVLWKMSWAAFDKARRELIDEGFIVILEHHYRDQRAIVYGPSRKYHERAKDIAQDREAGRIVKRLRMVDGAARYVSEWEPAKSKSAAYIASRKASWAAAVASQRAKAGVPASDTEKASRRRRTKAGVTREALEDILSAHVDVNDDKPVVVHVDVNDKAASRSRGRRHNAYVDVNERGTSPAPQGDKPQLKPLTAAHAFAIKDRIAKGESVAAIRADIEAAGFEFNVIIPKGAKP